MRLLPFVLVALLSSCTLIPNSVVRVALPPGDVQAAEDWGRVGAVLRADPSVGPFEVVAPDSFPPPDLVWFDGNLAHPEYLAEARAPNRDVEVIGLQAGLAPAWLGLAGDRILPLAWNPWSWWEVREGALPPPSKPEDKAALQALDERQSGATVGGGPAPAGSPERQGQVWRSWATVQFSPERTKLDAVPAEVVVARVKGFWWNAKGWNTARVPAFLAALWSPKVQDLWRGQEDWLAVTEPRSVVPRTIVVLP